MEEENSTEIIDKEEIYEFIEEQCIGVPFTEIEDRFGKGSFSFENRKANVVYWHGLRPSVADGLIELYNEKRILLYPTNILVYLIGGKVPMLPIVKKLPKNGYKEPHWLPLLLYTVRQAKGILNTKQTEMYRKGGYDV